MKLQVRREMCMLSYREKITYMVYVEAYCIHIYCIGWVNISLFDVVL